MPLDPVFAEMLKQMADAGGPPLDEMSPADARQMYRGMQADLPKPAIGKVVDQQADDIPIRVYYPGDAAAAPCVVYFHGGGWVIGDLTTHDSVCRQLADKTGFTLISVDYRLAPEHPFPAAIDDCYAATRWVAEHAAALKVDPAKIAVAGDSAGGNLSACVCLKAREEGGPAIACQLLIYPVTDTALDTSSYRDNADGYLLTLDSMIWFWEHYLGHGELKAGEPGNRDNPLAAPAKADSLAGLPPACVITAEFDPLRDEGEAYAQRLIDEGVATEVRRYDGMIHGFFGMTNLVEGSRQAMTFATEYLKQELYRH